MSLAPALCVLCGASAPAGAGETVIRVDSAARQDAAPAGEATATLGEALERARVLKQEDAGRQIAIELSPGVHRLVAPVRIGPGDGGHPGQPLVVRGAAVGGARVVGSAPLLEVPVAPEALAKFPAEARPHLKAYRLPPALKAAPVDISRRLNDGPTAMPFEIFDRRGALRPARWPDEGFATGRPIAGQGSALVADPERAARWAGEPELWLSGFMHWDWGYETTRISRLDLAAGRIELTAAPQFGFRDAPRIAVHHAAAELDRPGEWYRDAATGTVFVWPREGGAEIEVSLAESLLVVDSAAHVRIENLIFERVRGDAIRIHRSRDVVVERSTVRWAGARGVLIEESFASGVARSRITDTGEGGITLSGGDRQRLIGAGLFTIDSRVERFARLGLAARPAVRLAGVGNRAAGNYIAEAAQLAVLFTGNEHTIELNEITRVLADTSDSGAIYTYRDWTAQGTVIRHNYLHGLHARPGTEIKGVYLDDLASGITVEGNVFLGVGQPVFIGGGRDNTVARNIFVGSAPGVHIDGRGVTWAAKDLADPESEINAALRAVPIRSLQWIDRYPRLFAILDDAPGEPRRNRAFGNLFLGGAPYRLLPEVDRSRQQLERPVTGADVGLADADVKTLLSRINRASDIPGLLATLRGVRLSDLPFHAMDRDRILADVGAAEGKP